MIIIRAIFSFGLWQWYVLFNFDYRMKIDIGIVKEDRNFSDIDDEKASVLVDTLYEYSVLVFNIYNKVVA